jgi:hypothetical protein
MTNSIRSSYFEFFRLFVKFPTVHTDVPQIQTVILSPVSLVLTLCGQSTGSRVVIFVRRSLSTEKKYRMFEVTQPTPVTCYICQKINHDEIRKKSSVILPAGNVHRVLQCMLPLFFTCLNGFCTARFLRLRYGSPTRYC